MTHYEVIYTDDPEKPEEEWETFQTTDPKVNTATIPNLKEKTEYTFKIRGSNQLGPGLYSGPFTATTWLAREDGHPR